MPDGLPPPFPLPQCLSPSYLPLRCMAGGCGRLLRGPESCSLGCAQATQCALCLRRPHCGWCTWGGQDGGGRCLEGGLSGPRDGETGGFGDGVRVWPLSGFRQGGWCGE